MAKVDVKQALQLFSVLGNNADWEKLDSGLVQEIIDRPIVSGAEFTRFLANGGRVQVISEHMIDCDADPFLPEGWEVVERRKGGQLRWDPARIRQVVKLNPGEASVQGNELRNRLKNEPVLNANVLDYLLRPENQHLIPEEWGDGYGRFFWGTIYRDPNGDLYVRCLYRDGGQWRWDYYWLEDRWDARAPALASDRLLPLG